MEKTGLTKNGKLRLGVEALYILLFLISFFSNAFVLVFYLALIYYCSRGLENCLKALFLITIRLFITSAVAVKPSYTLLRLGIIYYAGLCIIYYIMKLGYKKKVTNVIISLLPFVAYTLVISFVFGSYPVSSIFKLLSFAFPCIMIMIGVSALETIGPLIRYITRVMTYLFFASIFMIPFSRFRLVNDNFQGMFNHVNMFGILGALYITLMLNDKVFTRHKSFKVFMIAVTFLMIYISASRTGMFASIAVILVKLLFSDKLENRKKTSIIIAGMLVLVFAVVVIDALGVSSGILSKITGFVYKGYDGSLFATRENQINNMMTIFESNPWFGRGFMTPYNQGHVTYSLSMDLVVEPGNIFWALLAFTGICGLVLFCVFFITILLNGNKKNLYMLVGAVMINFGEMVFFSTNSIAVILYCMIGFYLFDNTDEDKPTIPEKTDEEITDGKTA